MTYFLVILVGVIGFVALYFGIVRYLKTEHSEHLSKSVGPVHDALDTLNAHIRDVEKERGQAYGSVTALLTQAVEGQERLWGETSNLAKAMRSPNIRGRWGELQLKRTVEVAGMLEHCDFIDHPHVDTEDGRLIPDMAIKLPDGKQVIVDAKAPLEAYMNAIEAKDEGEKKKYLQEHCKYVREHVRLLSGKTYWSQFENTPDLVILFLPGEAFFSMAVEHDPEIIEDAARQKIIIASPTTLIAMLKAIHFGWKQDKLSASAQQISKLGTELHDRIATASDHLGKVGTSLTKAVESYNTTVNCVETRVLPSARKFVELGIETTKEITDLSEITEKPKVVKKNGSRSNNGRATGRK